MQNAVYGVGSRAVIVLIDNYDSFVHNLARYLRQLGQETMVLRNDATTPDEVARLRPKAIVLSPGPCTPKEAGCSQALVRRLAGEVPMLGVCLGHQTIGAALGATVVGAPLPMHGRSSSIQHTGRGIFSELPNPLTVGRYHSLVLDEATLPAELEVTARSDDGSLMALAHRRWPVFGVQFHPESILTEGGHAMLANFLKLAGIAPSSLPQSVHDEWPEEAPAAALPDRPVTF